MGLVSVLEHLIFDDSRALVALLYIWSVTYIYGYQCHQEFTHGGPVTVPYGNRYYVLYVHFGYTNLEIACYSPHSILSRVRPCTDYIVQQESSTASLVKTVTTHMWEKLAGLLNPDCQRTGGTAEMKNQA